jgi:diguanylate cyclase (GGDEF)-like protein
MANRDALTGVKSKHAYIEAEDRINEDIRNGSEGEFAVAVCDLNDLKLINDTKGHKAGDEYIVKACQIICKVFDHSPVFRIGGDEFVAILRNSDYENRAELRDRIGESNSSNTDGVIIACGIAEFDKERDSFLADVFERADEAMYNNKKELKNR